MRDFSWQYFMMTGDVDAYLLYRASQGEPLITGDGHLAEKLWTVEASAELDGGHENSQSL